jgi:ABC-type transport system substrate-binding protein
VRNPYFRQWSYAAQPAGYPNVIRFDQVAGPAKQESAVIAGRADLTAVYSNNGQSLATRYPARVHTTLKLWTEYLFLNTRQPPFTNLKARQAVNYAIDRGRILQLSHLAPGQAAVTCQMLPADFPGHHSYCPYTTGTKDGIWHSPDMAKARRLAKDSHTTNVPVTVWILKDFASRALASYLVRMLKDLGYRAHQRTVPGWRFFPAVSNFHSKIQAGLNGWGADFPTASDFFLPVLSCRSFYQDPNASNTSNYAGFCDRHADQLASQAQAAQLADPATARRLWAQVDRIVTDQAPWVPILSQGSTTFVSARTGNYQQSPIYGPLFDQVWVR